MATHLIWIFSTVPQTSIAAEAYKLPNIGSTMGSARISLPGTRWAQFHGWTIVLKKGVSFGQFTANWNRSQQDRSRWSEPGTPPCAVRPVAPHGLPPVAIRSWTVRPPAHPPRHHAAIGEPREAEPGVRQFVAAALPLLTGESGAYATPGPAFLVCAGASTALVKVRRRSPVFTIGSRANRDYQRPLPRHMSSGRSRIGKRARIRSSTCGSM